MQQERFTHGGSSSRNRLGQGGPRKGHNIRTVEQSGPIFLLANLLNWVIYWSFVQLEELNLFWNLAKL